MVEYISVKELLERQDSGIPLLDIRSPGEFFQGHIPGAISFPLFNDEERKVVGTEYKHSGPEKAFLTGLEYAGKKMSHFVRQASSLHSNNLLLHCWRGGKRSESMAWLLSQAGHHCFVLKGGYKAYRKYIRSELERATNLLVLGGMTGSNKTGMLKEMQYNGLQVIDLEALAHHKGSAFGHINEPEQPTSEQFENDLFYQWDKLDHSLPVWLEDESRTIGKVVLPDIFYENKRNAPLLVVEVPKESRIAHLVEDYAGIDDNYLYDALMRIKKKLGGDNLNACLQALEEKNYHMVADISLSYYDKAYNYAITSYHAKENVFHLPLESTDPVMATEKILDWYTEFSGISLSS